MGERSILITGCSSGIGHDAAGALRARGWRVFASAREAEDCARLRAEGFESPRIDYADAESVAAGLADVLEATGGRLDALYNKRRVRGCRGSSEDLSREVLAGDLRD